MHQDDTDDVEALPAVRELAADPAISAVWTELDPLGHRIWLARGANGHPWLLAADSLKRFREMISELSR
jgi:hypothetical protein